MTESMLSKVARARWERMGTRCVITPWPELPADMRAGMIEDERAILRSLQEPTAAMVKAGMNVSVEVYVDYYTQYTEDLDEAEAIECWQEMLAAILKEKKEKP